MHHGLFFALFAWFVGLGVFVYAMRYCWDICSSKKCKKLHQFFAWLVIILALLGLVCLGTNAVKDMTSGGHHMMDGKCYHHDK